MQYVKNLLNKLRYSHPLRLFFDAIAKFGIRITLFYLYRESLSEEQSLKLSVGFEEYEMSFWGPEEMKEIALIPRRRFTEADLLKRLGEGHKCLGLKRDGALVGFTWCNLKEISMKWYQSPLKENEAYLFDAYTLMPYRGMGIAPYLRNSVYKELKKVGRTALYSYSDFFNTPAIKFKQKLKAEKIKLNIVIELFKKWHFTFNLKDYQ